MTMNKLFLGFVGGIFMLMGVLYALNPSGMLSITGMQIPTSQATIDAVAVYAGIQLGFGGFLIMAARNAALQLAALLSTACILGGLALARTLSMVWLADYDSFHIGALLFEWPIALMAWRSYKAQGTESRN